MLKNKKAINLLVLFFLLIIPWIFADYTDDITPEKITSDLGFYEVNPCKISLFEFILKNPNVMYQDHYIINSYDYSSINCFGKISGITQVGYNFYIAVGTNNLISLVSQGLLWIFLLSLVPKDKKIYKISKLKNFLISFLTSSFFTFLIFSESRFYRDSYYLMDFEKFTTYFYIFCSIFVVIDFSSSIILNRRENLINFLPFSILFIGTFNGLNFHYLELVLVFFGIYSLLFDKVLQKFNKLFIIFTFFWTINSYFSFGVFFLSPDKLRGFTSSIYRPETVFAWSLLTLFLVNGCVYLLNYSKRFFNTDMFIINATYTVTALLSLGFIGANNPIFKLMNFYIFGQQKYGVSEQNPFSYNEISEKIAWRGFYPSAEAVGEFYGIILLLLIFKLLTSKKLKISNVILTILPIFGIYFSNNRTVMVLLVIFFIILFVKKFQNRKILILSSIVLFISFIFYIYNAANLQYNYGFYSESIYNQTNFYSLEQGFSSYANYINSIYSDSYISQYIFGAFSFIGYILNRSELWGVFFARYNPNAFEILFGSGPFNFGKLYGEIEILNSYRYKDAFILPHSSILSFLVFFGVLGLLCLIIYLLIRIWNKRKSIKLEGYLILLYIFINLIKSDSINYFPSALFYFCLIYILINLDNDLIFRKRVSINNS